MENELWKLLDSIYIYEIKEITGGTDLFILLTIAMCAILGVCSYLIYTAFSESNIRKGVLSILATALVMAGGIFGAKVAADAHIRMQLCVPAEYANSKELRYYFDVQYDNEYELNLIPRENYDKDVYQWWEDKNEPANWKPLADDSSTKPINIKENYDGK